MKNDRTAPRLFAATFGVLGAAVVSVSAPAQTIPESPDPIILAINEWTGQHVTTHIAGEILVLVVARNPQTLLKKGFPRGFGGVGKSEQREIGRVNNAVFHERVKIDDFLPVALIEQDNGHLSDFTRLAQRKNLEQLVHRAEAAGKYDERFGAHRQVHLAHGEVVKVERELWR